MKKFSALALMLWCAGSAGADSCRSFSYGRSFSYARHVPYVAPAAVVYPVYSLGYQPDLSAIAANLERLATIQETQQQILQHVIQNGGGPQKQQAPEHPGVGLLRQDCASCHDATVAKAKGRGVVLFERGILVADSPEAIKAIKDEIRSGRMPKNQKWDFERKYVAADFLDAFKEQKEQAAQVANGSRPPPGAYSEPVGPQHGQPYIELLEKRLKALEAQSVQPMPEIPSIRVPRQPQNGKAPEKEVELPPPPKE